MDKLEKTMVIFVWIGAVVLCAISLHGAPEFWQLFFVDIPMEIAKRILPL